MLEAVERDEPSPREFKLYQGRYRFWRHGRFGLVDGTVEILRHDVAGNPYHLHVHTQVVDENGKYSRTFSYEGGVIWLERNLWFIHVGKGEIRFGLIPRVTNPRREHMVGMFLGEEHDGNRNPFGGKTLLCHEDWLEHNGDLLTEDWILAQLRNGAPKDAAGGQDMMRM